MSNQLNISAHGTDGPLGITLAGYSIPTDARVLNATKEIGGQFSFNLDMSTGNSIEQYHSLLYVLLLLLVAPPHHLLTCHTAGS